MRTDYFWFAILLLPGIGSAGAWLRQYLKRDEREEITETPQQDHGDDLEVEHRAIGRGLLAMQRDVDAIIRETLDCHEDGAIDEEDLAAFGLVLELFDHAVADRRAALEAGPTEPTRLRAR